MQVAHMLFLLSTDYNHLFEKGAQETLKYDKKAKTQRSSIYVQDFFYQPPFPTNQEAKKTEKTVEHLKSEQFERVSSVASNLVSKVKKSLQEGSNKGSIKLSNWDVVSWPEESVILRSLFQRYLSIELSDSHSDTRNPKETTLTVTWEHSHQKALTQLLGLPQKNKESKQNDFRLSEKFCDCTLVVGGRQFPVHKFQLSKKSPYFEKFFCSGFKEGCQENVINLPDPTLTPELFEAVVEFIYVGYTRLSNKNPTQLILLAQKANMFMLPKLEFLCNRMLLTKLDKESWREIATYALSVNDGQILQDHAAYYLMHQGVRSQIEKLLEQTVTMEELCEYYDLASGYKGLLSIKKRIEKAIEDAITKETFKECCELGTSLHTGSAARNFLEKHCRNYAEAFQEWLNAEMNKAVKAAYIKLCTGLVYLD